MNTLRKAMEWLTCFSVLNLMLGYLLFKKFEKFNECCPLSKAARMSSYLVLRSSHACLFELTTLPRYANTSTFSVCLF